MELSLPRRKFFTIKDTMVETKDKVSRDHLSMVAAAMSYYMLFAFVPFLGSILLLYALFSNPEQMSSQIASMAEKLPPEVQEIIRTQIAQFMGQTTQLKIGAIVSLVVTLWAASKGTNALIDALNIIYEREEKRNIIKLSLLSLFLTIIAAFLSVLSVAVIIGIPSVIKFLPLSENIKQFLPYLSWGILLVAFASFLTVSYGIGACRSWRYWKKVMIGSSIASLVWAFASLLFTWYVASFGNFNKTYGSLAAIIILMFWFYISSYIILLGAEISASLEKRKRSQEKGTLV
ncbi:MAG TPA: YihY/virulence factor BrkB family protein [Bacteriovoracaceae bacterium]|nr:YihY/virulence factor BrkB family protein [Bacteriovoracaceae bacterium]